jgi:hypothetical protein
MSLPWARSIQFRYILYDLIGVRGSAVGWGTALPAGRSRVRFPIDSLEFFSDLILPVALWPKWVPGILPGGKDGRCVGLTTLPTSCADCLEILRASTSWNPKGLSRPVVGKLYLYFTLWFNYLQWLLSLPLLYLVWRTLILLSFHKL